MPGIKHTSFAGYPLRGGSVSTVTVGLLSLPKNNSPQNRFVTMEEFTE